MNPPRRDLLAFFNHHRVAANLLMVMMIMAGIWSLAKLNTQFFPSFELDIVTVRVVWPGASAEDVEQAVTRPLEQVLRTADGLHEISSTSATGVSAITLEFEEGTEMGAALDQINERVARVRELPDTAEDPEISRVIRYERVARLVLLGESVVELRDLAHRIEDELLDRGIAKIDIRGLPAEELAIEVPQQRLLELGLSLEDLGQRIRSNSHDLPAGVVGDGEVARQLRSLDQQRSLLGFNDLTLASEADGRLVNLGDVADLRRGPQQHQVHLYRGERSAVELTLLRAESGDTLKSAKILEQWLAERGGSLPRGIELAAYDQAWEPIEERINLLLTNGLGGLLLVIVILFIFLDGRVALWVMLGIPISFMATLAILYYAGGSINMISLFGMIMAVGIIVDDAIVVAEESQTQFQRGQAPEAAAEIGARRMLAPVVSSSLTTIAAFLPLMLIGGIVGNILFQIPLVVVCVVLASLLECFLILPAHIRAAFVKNHGLSHSRLRHWLDEGFERLRDRRFLPLVKAAVKQRYLTLSLTVGALIVALSLVASGRIGFTFFPSVEGTLLQANISFTAGTPKVRVDEFLRHLQETMERTEGELGGNLVTFSLSLSGEASSGQGSGTRQGEQYGAMVVELTSPDQRPVSNEQFLAHWRGLIQIPPGMEIFNLSQRMGGHPGQDIDIRLSGADADRLKAAALELQRRLAGYPGVSAIEDDLPWGQEQLVFHINPTGRALGLSTESLGRQLRHAFEGYPVQVFQEGSEEIEVNLRLPLRERHSITALHSLQVRLPSGQYTPLLAVAHLEGRKGFEALRHSDTHLTVRVSANVDRRQNNANRIIRDLEETYLADFSRRHGVSYRYGGRTAEQKETMGEMAMGALMGLVLIYLILTWVFASYSKPLVIMSAIPFGFIGAVFGHLVMGLEMTILSLFGIFGLAGIVVNDSIILINLYQQLREQGMSVTEAVPEAARQRLRAVLLTSLTTIAGLTPLLFETSVQAQFLIPMAVSLTFGLAFSTLLVLLVIPALLSLLESLVHALKRQRHTALSS